MYRSRSQAPIRNDWSLRADGSSAAVSPGRPCAARRAPSLALVLPAEELVALASRGLRPIVSGGARVALRGAGGVEYLVNRHLALIAELGVEYLVNPEADVKHTLFIPAIGAAGRL
jgi:hypothetical protein